RHANVLGSRGLRKGDRLALMSPNTEGFVFTFYAALRLGLIVVPVNPRMAPPEVTHLLDDSGARAMVFDPVLAEVALAGHRAAQNPPEVLFATRDGSEQLSLQDEASEASVAAPDVVITADDDA